MTTKNEYKPQSVPPPAVLLSEEMEEKQIDSNTLATKLNISLTLLNAILAGSAAITVDIAEKLSDIFGGTSNIWLNWQKRYDTYIANLSNNTATKMNISEGNA